MKTQDAAHHSSPTVSSTMEPAENVYSNVPDKFSATTEPVPVDAFRKHVSHLSSVGGFLKEFQVSWLLFDYLLFGGHVQIRPISYTKTPNR